MEVTNKIVATCIEVKREVVKTFTPEFNSILIRYAIARIHQKFNIKYDLQRGFRGIMVEDIISDLMLSFIREDGGRNWNKAKFPDFKKQVISSLDSHIFNTIEKELEKTAQTNTRIDNLDITEEDSVSYEEILDNSHKILTDLGATDEEILMFEPFVIHKMKRSDIAKEFGISEKEVTNIKKRLDRKIPKLRERIKGLI